MSVAKVLAWKLRMKLSKKAGEDKRNLITGKTIPYDQEIARMEREIATLKSRIYN